MKKYFVFVQDYYQKIGKLNQGYWIQVSYWKYVKCRLKRKKTKKEI